MSFMFANSGDFRNSSVDEHIERCMESVRKMCVEYAAHQTKHLTDECVTLRFKIGELRAECLELRAERETLRRALVSLANTSDAVCWCHSPVCINQQGCEFARRALALLGAPTPEDKQTI